jgi:hypothetical protein
MKKVVPLGWAKKTLNFGDICPWGNTKQLKQLEVLGASGNGDQRFQIMIIVSCKLCLLSGFLNGTQLLSKATEKHLNSVT